MSELGNRLREAREEKGLTLDDLEEMTKIQKRYLKGIEEGNYDLIPGKFYVRAFIKQYAETVGLDADLVFEEYRSEIPSVYDEDLPEAISRTQARRQVSRGASRFFEVLPKIILAVFIVGAVVLLWYFVQKGVENQAGEAVNEARGEEINVHQSGELPAADENEDTEEDEATSEENESAEEPGDEAGQQIHFVSEENNREIYELVNADQFLLKLAVVDGGTSWVSVRGSDGKEIQQATLNINNPELELDVSDQEFVDIRMGYSPATEIFVNEEKLEFEPTNDVKNIRIQFTQSEE